MKRNHQHRLNAYCVLYVACASAKEARRILDALLRQRLVACGQIIPAVESHFWWRGKRAHAREVLMNAKAMQKDFARIERVVSALHSYEVPELIALPMVAASRAYRKWLASVI